MSTSSIFFGLNFELILDQPLMSLKRFYFYRFIFIVLPFKQYSFIKWKQKWKSQIFKNSETVFKKWGFFTNFLANITV